MSDSYLRAAQVLSADRLDGVRAALQEAHDLVAGKACVYATGSFGRHEAGSKSDLDLFIVVDTALKEKDGEEIEARLLRGIEEIKLKYFLIKAVEQNEIAEFDGDGKYLESHTIPEFVKHLGSRYDDSKNTLTGRLLLMLESKPILESGIYDKTLSNVINAYFIDYDDNEHNFVPAFLINDILRMWRTFCVNYEHKRKGGTIKSKTKNIKLKYSRMLACYSAIIYLAAVFTDNRTVSREDVRRMVDMTPTERLEAVARDAFWREQQAPTSLAATIDKALQLYSEFLELVHKEESEVAVEFEKRQQEWRGRSHHFGKKLAEVLNILKDTSPAGAQIYRIVLT